MPKRLTQAEIDRLILKLKRKIEKAKFVIAIGVENVIHENSGLPMPDLAAIHEYGTADGRIPARAPFGTTMATHRAKHRKGLRIATTAVLKAGNLIGAQRLASSVVADVQGVISQGLTPPLKQETIDRKGSSTPLIDDGALRQSISAEVIKL